MNFPNPEDYIAYIRSADWLLVLFYGFLVAATTYSMVLAVKAFRHRITWGQARRMGVPFAIFVWLQAIFYFVVFDGAYGIVSIVLATPLWLDLLISAITIIAVGILFFILQRRPKFKPHLFIPLVLIPLGIPGTHLVAKLVRVGAIEVAPVGALMALKHGDTVAEVLGDYADDISIHIPLVRSIPKATETVIGQITFLTTVGKGVLGDALTARRLTGMGYEKLPSKYDVVHGIDAIYIKWNPPSTVNEILIVENKVDGGRLAAGQMSDDWVTARLQRLLLLNDAESQKTAKLILNTLDAAPERVKKQLWRHQLASGTTSVYQIDPAGQPASSVLYSFQDNFIANELAKRCKSMPDGCILN